MDPSMDLLRNKLVSYLTLIELGMYSNQSERTSYT